MIPSLSFVKCFVLVTILFKVSIYLVISLHKHLSDGQVLSRGSAIRVEVSGQKTGKMRSAVINLL